MAAGFITDAPGLGAEAASLAKADPKLVWSVRRYMNAYAGSPARRAVVAGKRAMVVRLFATQWPPVPGPSSGWWGDTNPHDASEYIIGNINALGVDLSKDAGDELARLVSDPDAAPYHEHIRHMRARQRSARRDQEYIAPSFEQIKHTLSGRQAGTIDVLKAVTLDCLAEVQLYLRDGDTRGWGKFWSGGEPLDEQGCRDRLLDDMRPRVRGLIGHLMPESLMPERKRVDILALHEEKGLPIEVKGQWHAEVWDAASTQLEERYTRDWRAFGRGIYLVFWFGATASKRLTKHPDGKAAPQSTAELRAMLEARLSESERARIDVVVFDASRG